MLTFRSVSCATLWIVFAPGCGSDGGDRNASETSSATDTIAPADADSEADAAADAEAEATLAPPDTAPDGDTVAACDPLAPLHAVGTLSNGVAAVPFDSVAVDFTHKLDVDAAEDGCVAAIHVIIAYQQGCRLELRAAGVRDASGLQVQSVTLSADSFCPEFSDAQEGVYQGVDGLTQAWVTSTIWEVPGPSVATACFAATIEIKLAGVLRRADGATLDISAALTIDGDVASTGDVAASCPCGHGYCSCSASAPDHGTVGGGTAAVPVGYGESATYACDAGYALGGTAPRCTGATGVWDGPEPTCTPITCAAPAPEHGTVNEQTAPVTLAYGESAKYACEAEYQLDGVAVVTCGGTSQPGSLSGPPPTCTRSPFVAVEANSLSCGLRANGRVECWGCMNPSPAGECQGHAWAKRIAVGSQHACAIEADDSVVCWGINDDHQTDVPPGLKAKAIDAGEEFTCAIRMDDTVACWGAAANAQTSPPVGLAAKALACGTYHACAVATDLSVQCWGSPPASEAYGQLSPPAGLTATAIGVGYRHACALDAVGVVTCWGGNDKYQLNVPEMLQGEVQAVSAGGRHTCVLGLAGAAACFGDSSYGQTNAPNQGFLAISAGQLHSCAVDLSGYLACWGYEALGRTAPPTF